MNQRLKTIDLARGASVFIMIIVHTLWMYASFHKPFGRDASFPKVLGRMDASFHNVLGREAILP